MTQTPFDAGAEFDRQLTTLLALDYPALAGAAPDAFAELLRPLRATALERAASMAPPAEGRVPFVLVVTRDLVPIEEMVPRTRF